jgi:putative sigma-54 modulation protein
MANKSNDLVINTTFRGMEPSDPIRLYAEEKISKPLSKFIHQDTTAHIILKVEKHRHIAEVTFNWRGKEVSAKVESEDMYKAVDLLEGSISQQLRKLKEKLTERH